MKVLVVTSQMISAEQVRDALPGDLDPTQGEVMILAPALAEGRIKFWTSDPDESIVRAEEVQQSSVEQMQGDGVAARGDTGESDPLTAIEDALGSFAADRIVLFTRAEGGRYLEDVDPAEIQERFGVPVDQVR
ncbi:MAG: hypothetical protein M3Z27_07190 [Actinomycetota bacterium]|nr:hypothetical protein [Actinomycetota bacterium]